MNRQEFYNTYSATPLILEKAKAGTRYGMIEHHKPRPVYYTVDALQDGAAMLKYGAFEVIRKDGVLTEIFPASSSPTVSIDKQTLHELLPRELMTKSKSPPTRRTKSKSPPTRRTKSKSPPTRRTKSKSPIGSAKKSK